MILSVHQPQYIPWIGYFDKIDKSDCFVFLDNVQYKVREYQNRNKIRTKDGWMWLTVPVVSKGLGRQKIRDIRIDNSFDWKDQHWKSLRSCYNKAPHFKKHSDFFEDIYSRKWEKLIDINVRIIEYLLKAFKISTPLHYESVLAIKTRSTERIVDICKHMKADTYLSGTGGKEYLKEESFTEGGIKLIYQDFVHPVYRQMHTKDKDSFLPFMSAIDLLFNEGGMIR